MATKKTVTKTRKARKRPIHAFAKQARWLLWRMASEQKCCFCDKLLFETFDTKTCNQITIHHLEGDKSTDNFDELAPVDKMLFAHSACHKAFHLMERMDEQGKNIDRVRFNKMNRTCEKHARMNARKVA